ncbi:STAS domain-containing protein [Dokdonella soli]|uniref:STAS domain-containing protein n=1 Tax=Dokdonella soli TaxID=529810 RepID=A0ABN1IPP2_9GAMM
MTATLRIERVDAGHVRVAGRLGFAEAATALMRGNELAGSGAREVVVDIAGLQDVDSATLAILLAWAARARIGRVVLRFTGVPDALRALAHLCDAEPLLGIA